MIARRAAAILLLVFWAATAGAAQSYPDRPIRLIVAAGVGGGLDFVGRLIAPYLAESLGQTVVIDNRPGATGTIAAETTARSGPDGHTLLLMSASLIVYGAVSKTSYDILADFAPVSQLTGAPYILIVHPTVPAKTTSELVAYAKANPRKLNYFSTGNASFVHLVTELFQNSAGIELVHIPYKGLGAAWPDLLSARIHVGFATPAFAMPQLRSQALRPLAITSTKRVGALPEVPTMAEAGVPGFVVTQWEGVVATGRTPQPVVERLHREIVKALRQPDVSSRLEKEAIDVVGSSPREFGAHLKAEHERWSAVIKKAGLTVN